MFFPIGDRTLQIRVRGSLPVRYLSDPIDIGKNAWHVVESAGSNTENDCTKRYKSVNMPVKPTALKFQHQTLRIVQAGVAGRVKFSLCTAGRMVAY